MTREEAARIVAAHLAKHRVPHPGLDSSGRAGTLVEGEQLAFEHDGASGALRCSAHIYRFRERPKDGLIEALREEARQPTAVTEGAGLVFNPATLQLALARQYTEVPTASAFERDLTRLREACLHWREEVFARVAEQVHHRGA